MANDLWSVDKVRAWAIMPKAQLLTFLATTMSQAAIDELLQETYQDNVTGTVDNITLDISSASVSYAVNELPGCTLAMALGRRADDVTRTSHIHSFFPVLEMRFPVDLYIHVIPTAGNTTQWPVGPFRLFEGRLAGINFRKTFGSVELVLTLDHWLADLNYSSALSQTSSPSNPINLLHAASMYSVGNQATGATGNPLQKYDSPAVMWQVRMGAPEVMNDFWGYRVGELGGIKAFLEEICSADRFNWNDVLSYNRSVQACPNFTPNLQSKNADSLAAIAKFEPFTVNGAPTYTFGKPLMLRSGFTAGPLPGAIAYDVAGAPSDVRALANTTIWNKLVGHYSSSYLFAVVPMVSRALVVPFTPGLREPWQVIKADEYFNIETNSTVPHNVRGIALLAGRSMYVTGADGQPKGAPDLNAAGPIYDTCQTGQILTKQCPPWIANSILNGTNLALSIRQPQLTAHVKGGSTVAAPPAQVTLEAAEMLLRKNLWTAYAHTLYLHEVLRHRQARISGKLRLDIGPGSEIAIEATDDRFIDIIQQETTDTLNLLHGTVLRVSVAINAETQQAGTSFQVAFLRNDRENSDDRYSTTGHFLWDTEWRGAPLAEPITFGQSTP